MKIEVVRSPGGIEAWLVEQHGLPLVTMQFAFLGGATQDPPALPGVASFLSAMLDEGAGELGAHQFQERQEELAMRMRFDAGRDTFSGSFQTLTDRQDECVGLLGLALARPRFDADAVERVRRQLLAHLAFDEKDPDKVADEAWFAAAFPGHPYARPTGGTSSSVAAVGGADLEAYRRRVFARDQLKVAVVGDIDAKGLGRLLDAAFGALPTAGDLVPVPPAERLAGPVHRHVEMGIPQSVARFGQAGLARKHPDFTAAFVVNYVLGGGGFSSRLMEQVRERRGLAYSVYSSLQTYRRSALLAGGVATKTEAMGTSLEVIRAELARMAAEGPSAQELEDAKRYLTGSYALRFTSSGSIAGQLLGIQIEDLGLDYVDKRNDMVEAVTLEDARRVAASLITPEKLIVTVVGRPA